MDGNNSLWRVERKEDALQDVEKDGKTLHQTSRERLDHHVGSGDYFASRSETTTWDEANWPHANELPAADSPATHVWEEGAEKAECKKRGEQKPNGRLAVVYDIMCKFSKTVRRSPLNSLAIWGMFLPVIGTMYGYAHERACQLVFLMLYIVGVGLEDGEGCERYFSVTNSWAPITQYQSIFHRRQSVAEFAYYHDLQTYSNLSKFIYGNYKQALRIIGSKHLVCSRMQESGISPRRIIQWKEVLDLTFLSEFDLLHDSREDIREQQWATPKNRQIMLEFFKLIQAEEELQHLHVEIRRLLTFMHDEEHELHIKCTALEVHNPPLALQLQQHFQEHIRFNALHRRHLFAIKKLPGFDPHNINYFCVGTYVGRQNSMGVDEVEESGDVWFEDDEDDLNARWITVVDTATVDAL
ncbi:hypothetical protein HHX47_DHR9000529 [Lentinula edodes]|nr:hypothetical protein HHX47_DHR9000529 [Lentinula edodes]